MVVHSSGLFPKHHACHEKRVVFSFQLALTPLVALLIVSEYSFNENWTT